MKADSSGYAVIFSSRHTGEDPEGYRAMADRMEVLAAQQDGFLGMESARDETGFGITISYWRDEASIQQWKRNAEHLLAQKLGREKWYRCYSIRIARISREYHFPEA